MKVKVLNHMGRYPSCKDLGKKYEKDGLKFECYTEVEDGDVYELIEYTKHLVFNDRVLAVCKNENNKIILIGSEYVEEIDEVKTDKIKIGDYGIINCNYYGFKKGERVRIVGYWKLSVHSLEESDYGYEIESLDGKKSKKVYSRRVDSIEETKPLLPVGTKLRLVKTIFGIESVPVGAVGIVTKAKEDRIVVRYRLFSISVNALGLKEEWEVVKDEWSEWRYNSNRAIWYRVKGRDIQAKDECNKVFSRCMDCDTFDLEKGLDICAARLDLKNAQQDLERLIK